MSRRRRKSHVKGLWFALAPAVWAPVSDLDEAAVRGTYEAFNIETLQKKARELGIDDHVSKASLAISVTAGRNVFFPEEINRYSRRTLLHFYNSFQVSPLSKRQVEKLSTAELRTQLLQAWRGGEAEAVLSDMHQLTELRDVMDALEDQFCSERLKHVFRHAPQGQVSLRDHADQTITEALNAYRAWVAAAHHKEDRRSLYVQAETARSAAEGAVTEYLRQMRKHCKNLPRERCRPEHIPAVLHEWMKTSPLRDKALLCNVKLKGRKVAFQEGDQLSKRLRVYKVVEVPNPEDRQFPVTWLGVARDPHFVEWWEDAEGVGSMEETELAAVRGIQAQGLPPPRPLDHWNPTGARPPPAPVMSPLLTVNPQTAEKETEQVQEREKEKGEVISLMSKVGMMTLATGALLWFGVPPTSTALVV